jgi:hypothetical protein
VKRAGLSNVLKLWLDMHPAAMLLPAAVLIALAAVVELPVGPPERLTGRIERLTDTSTRMAQRFVAAVRLGDGRLVTVRLKDSLPCKAGGQIRLRREPRLLGRVYVAEFGACLAAPATPGARWDRPGSRDR